MAEQPNHLSPYYYYYYYYYVILFIFFISSTVISHKPACNKSDQESLWSSFDMPSSHLNWSSDDCCHWEGITCDMAGQVTHVSLPYKGLKLKGGNTSLFGNLSHLIHLNLSHNSLHGSLDQTRFFSSLNHLEILDLSYNLLSGELPISVPSSSIRMLDLSSNSFYGSIPSSLFRQAWNLTSFNVSNNSFTGSIPSSNICFHSYPSIKRLDFSFNQFNGSISHGLGKCSKLKVFHAGHNYNLSGFLPEDIYNATKLEELALPFNSLYGDISESIGKLSKLKLIFLQFNNLEGSLPSSLMNCTNLVELHLFDNHLKGDISTFNFSKLSQLTKLDLGLNQLTGILPISLYSCKSLKAIRLAFNDLEGQIQPEILSLKSLSFLSLGSNRLTNIMRAIKILMRCKSLMFLEISDSFLSEEMPVDHGMVDFDGFQNLRALGLTNCDLTGQIPVWLSKLKKLQVLTLEGNRITGSIPSWMGTLPRLSLIVLKNNLISGEFPKELCGLPMLVSEPTAAQVDDEDLELPIYVIHGALITQWKLSQLPRAISIDSNSIKGNIPVEIGQLQLLQGLDLANNNFSGNIPHQISNLTNLEILNLSMNHLSGNIPSSLANLHFLDDFNVSNNNLEGSIPTGTQLQTFDASSFEGNPKLCGAPLLNKCLPIKGNDADTEINQDHVEDGHENRIPWFHISVVLGFIVGFWGVCGSLVLNTKWRYAYFKFVHSVQQRLIVRIRVYGQVAEKA